MKKSSRYSKRVTDTRDHDMQWLNGGSMVFASAENMVINCKNKGLNYAHESWDRNDKEGLHAW